MVHHLAENIRKYRKDRGMTQEDLAEKLNLTLGTISKWERGSSEPELSYLMQLAQIFHISLDALIGFSIRSNNVDILIEKIEKHEMAREFEAAIKECEAALLIYPNHFRIVYQVASTYNVIGMVLSDKEALRTAIRHFQHSIDLFAQNTDPHVSIIEIQNKIAQCYLSLKETQKGIEELKKNNICGINDADIALNMIAVLKQDSEGIKYAQKAFGEHAATIITVLFALMTYYFNEKDPEQGLYTANWTVQYLKMLKKRENEVAFVDKYIASTLLIIAIFQDSMGDWEQAKATMLEAFQCAQAFDKEPCFNTKNTIFMDEIEDGYVYDSLGITSKQGLVRMMDEFHLSDMTSEHFCEYFQRKMQENESIR
ncbi:MAG: helix-turn-helix transcriptional regulator [Lachnospiraceae bacterium]|nr:helix-turn-helix transcriptional regulator [Lachnospiraceae bacterium]MBR3508809.1 helix-turn-helix transcriptional regulator [Lachnospiraceae bacterium]MBR4607938.1 helix-turn-helix transcriptional regulator [Lachnospiraceae bacterium]MBR6151656.1 helix-turn-helix transcriptional regulator [Lachnospiraceae bacterium]